MNNKEFINAVKQYVDSAAVNGVVENLKHPPGRKVHTMEKQRSAWYNSLSNDEKAYITDIIQTSVHDALFGLFTVLDGVRAIADEEDRGYFELKYISDKEVLLNGPDDIGLHELFNATD